MVFRYTSPWLVYVTGILNSRISPVVIVTFPILSTFDPHTSGIFSISHVSLTSFRKNGPSIPVLPTSDRVKTYSVKKNRDQ